MFKVIFNSDDEAFFCLTLSYFFNLKKVTLSKTIIKKEYELWFDIDIVKLPYNRTLHNSSFHFNRTILVSHDGRTPINLIFILIKQKFFVDFST